MAYDFPLLQSGNLIFLAALAMGKYRRQGKPRRRRIDRKSLIELRL
jgi:hypothetical protein